MDTSIEWKSEHHKELLHILHELLYLRNDVKNKALARLSKENRDWPSEHHDFSATNLSRYLAFRSHDIRHLQDELARFGLSSLGRGESDILANIEQIIKLLLPVTGTDSNAFESAENKVHSTGKHILTLRTVELFGEKLGTHYTRIMVTMPSDSAHDYDMIKTLIEKNMACARINCAHGNQALWLKMVEHIRKANSELNKSCKIFMDLAGLKIRTGLLGKDAHGEMKIRLFEGDEFILHTQAQCSVPSSVDPLTNESSPAIIACSNDVFMTRVLKGQAVWFDDGKLGSRIEEVGKNFLKLRVTHAGPKGVRIKPDKGINFPDTLLDVPTLTAEDLHNLDFVCQHADMVGLSFVQNAADLQQAFDEINQRQSQLPIVAKIETKAAVQNLPDILLTGLSYTGTFGVMIARGDLAVELGSVRMAEIQEEILWLCEAAHIPVIWATQVLESLAKKGIVSRPEITDAAMSVRAECVMLNKGDYIVDAVNVLDQILDKMQAHQYKKTTRLRALQW